MQRLRASSMTQAPHPSPARLGSFVRGDLSRQENRAMVRHLLRGCRDCSAMLRPLLAPPDRSLPRMENR
jgi:hypothetical protein